MKKIILGLLFCGFYFNTVAALALEPPPPAEATQGIICGSYVDELNLKINSSVVVLAEDDGGIARLVIRATFKVIASSSVAATRSGQT